MAGQNQERLCATFSRAFLSQSKKVLSCPKAINPCLQSTDILFSSGHPVNGLRSFVIERLVKPLTVIKTEIFSQAGDGLGRILVIMQVDLFVFDAAPEPFDEDVV